MTSAANSLSRNPAGQSRWSRELLLKQLAAARHAVCHRLLLAKPNIDRPAAVRVADQLVGLAPIWHFIQQRLPNSAPHIQKIVADAAGQTLNAVVERLKNQLSSLLLRRVFTSSDWNDALPLPDGLHQTFLAPCHQLPRVSLTSFGDLHQLCLSDRLDNSRAQRRSDGQL